MAEAPAAAGWTLKPYNNGAKELNLWPLESRKLVQSPVVIAPDRHVMAYTEVTFMLHNRQTFAVLYAVRNPQAMLAPVVDEPIAYVALPFRPSFWQRVRFWGAAGTATSVPPPMNPYLPEHHTQRRQRLFAAGDSVSSAHRFETLTIVDWSNSGKRLLFKRRSGVLYDGLHTSDILVYDEAAETTTLYDDFQIAIRHFWDARGTLPPLDSLTWDVIPVGWAPGSDTVIIVKAWAYDAKARTFLGIWQYDMGAERTRLVSLKDRWLDIAANGLTVVPQGVLTR